MPKYIELEKNPALPNSPSSFERVILSINADNQISVIDSGSINIPVGSATTTTTYVNASSSLSNKSLVAGTFYRITDVDTNLYGGTEIILHADTTESFSNSGIGKFYNPKYDKTVPGYGIWTNYIRFDTNQLFGFFQPNENITADGGQSGYSFSPISDYGTNYINLNSGDWTTATSVTGSNSGASASIQNVFVPSYPSSSKAIWGGKVWVNTTGNVSNYNDVLNLNESDWQIVPFDNVNYNVVWNEIEFDFGNNFITMRKDSSNNIVKESYANYYYIDNNYRSIAVFQWGNETDTNYGLGFSNNLADNSYVELVNFRGSICDSNTFKNYSYIFNVAFDLYSEFRRNIFDNSGFGYSFFGGYIHYRFYVNDNIANYSGIYGVTGTSYGAFQGNRMHNSGISGCNLIGSEISYNDLEDSGIYNNIVYLGDYGSINANQLYNSGIYGNNLINSYIQNNEINSNSSIEYNTLKNNSNIYSNFIDTNSNIRYNTITTSYIQYNKISNNSSIGDYNQNNIISNNSYIQNNNLTTVSRIRGNNIDTSTVIDGNSINGNSSIQNITASNQSIQNNALFCGNNLTNVTSSQFLYTS